MTIPTPPTSVRRGLRLAMLAAAAPVLWACSSDSDSPPEPPQAQAPNILFVVMDDIGVDQLRSFGYGGATPPSTPNIDTIAQAGVRFRNAWSMPTCSPTRATFFDGQYPFRSNVMNAIVSTDLANSQVSPFVPTTPKLLKDQGYLSAVIGKMHISGSDVNPANNPFGDSVMHELGWDYFEGYLDGGPFPIDTTAGGVANEGDGAGPYTCGFVPNTRQDPVHGADAGACYLAGGGCNEITTQDVTTPGRTCLEQGGIFDPGASCQASRPANLDFDTQNGYYTGDWIINTIDGEIDRLPPDNPSARGYRTTLETDRAVAWIKDRAPDQPWMMSVGYSAAHTPLQPPPQALLPAGSPDGGAFDCTATAQQRVISNQIIEAMDHEIGRLLVEAGLASYGNDGSLQYEPENTNTMVVLIGDNGTFAATVKAPFDATRSKATPYQTGVWVPLVVAGPQVVDPNREVGHMVNSADMYRLFAEVAGIDLDTAVPPSRPVDAESVLPYLTQPDHPAIRDTNFTQVGTNISAEGTEPPPPCVVPSANTCLQLFPQEGVCEDQGGEWYGPGGVAGPDGLDSCCAVNDYLAEQGQDTVAIFPHTQTAMRNENYKLVRMERQSCDTGGFETTDELYLINEDAPVPALDTADRNLLVNGEGNLAPEPYQNYQTLRGELDTLLASEITCPGDGNRDGVVNQEDLSNWQFFSELNEGRSSWYDFNHDGLTNEADRTIIQENLGQRCEVTTAMAGRGMS